MAAYDKHATIGTVRPGTLSGGSLPCYIADMERADRITILVSAAALCVTIIGTSCSTNARIDDLNARIDEMNASLTARIGEMNASLTARIGAGDAGLSARIDDLSASLHARIDDLRAEIAAQIAAVNASIDALDRDVRDLRAIVVDAIRGGAPAAD